MRKSDDNGTTHTAPPASGYSPHPLFPRGDEATVELRDVVLVTFQRRRSDGQFEHCPQDFEASDVQSWTDVMHRWGGGDYKAIGKNRGHQIVAVYPPRGWHTLVGPSTQFTSPEGTLCGPPIAEPATNPANPSSAAAPTSGFLTILAGCFGVALVNLIHAQGAFARAKVTATLCNPLMPDSPASTRAREHFSALEYYQRVNEALVELIRAQSALTQFMAWATVIARPAEANAWPPVAVAGATRSCACWRHCLRLCDHQHQPPQYRRFRSSSTRPSPTSPPAWE